MTRTEEGEEWDDFVSKNFQCHGFFWLTEVEIPVHGKEERIDEEMDENTSEYSTQFSDDEQDVLTPKQLKEREKNLVQLKKSVSSDIRQAKLKLLKASLRHDRIQTELLNEEIRALKVEKKCIKKTILTVKDQIKAAKNKSKPSETADDTAKIYGELPPTNYNTGCFGRIGLLFVQCFACN